MLPFTAKVVGYLTPYFRTIIQSHHYFINSYKYIYRNPVEAQLSKKVQDYPYSALFGLLGNGPINFPIIEDTLLFSDIDKNLKWLNNSSTHEDLLSMEAALKKSSFKLRKDRRTNKVNRLENSLL